MINGFIRFRSNLRKNDKKSSVSHKAEHKEQISKINIQISEIQKQISTLQTEKWSSIELSEFKKSVGPNTAKEIFKYVFILF